MVSLSRSYNTNSGGATFFSESVNMADREQLVPILENFGSFKKVKTLPLFGFHLLLMLILDIISIVYAVKHPDEGSRCAEYFVIIYLHIALWFVTFVIHVLAKYIHYKIRLNGYLDFYKSIEIHAGFTLVIVSLWTVMLLFVQTLMQHYYPDDFYEKCLNGGTLSPRSYLCGLITLEFAALAGINFDYMMKVINFNKQQPPPDVMQTEWLMPANPETFSQNEVGYREMGSKVYEFLEKQAELIRHLKEQNARLSLKVMQLNSQSRNLNLSGSGSSTVNT